MLIRSLLIKLKLVKRINFAGTMVIGGKKFKIPVINGISSGYSEDWMLELLKKFTPIAGNNFVDVGVNMGQTLLKSKVVFEQSNYVGFEPNTSCVHYLQKLVAVNGIKQCEIIPVGISDTTQIIKLNYYNENEDDQLASIVDGFRPDQPVKSSVHIPVFHGDDLTGTLPEGHNSMLKIDVEGAELEVISGLSGWIKKNAPFIIVEILPVYKADNTFRVNRQQQLERLLASLNYKIARINKQNIQQLDLLPEIGIHGDVSLSDYVLYHESDHEKLSRQFTILS